MEKMLLKTSEVIQQLGIGRSLVYDLIAQKELPSIRIGRCIRVPSSALEKWIEDRQTKKEG